MGKLDDIRNEVAIRLVSLVMYIATRRYRSALAGFIVAGVEQADADRYCSCCDECAP